MITIRRCRKCNEYLEDETVECPGCHSNLIEVGVKLEKTNKCIKCGDRLRSAGTTCRTCGARYSVKQPGWTMP